MRIERIPEVGDTGFAVATKGLGSCVTFSNDVGGTEFMPAGRFRVRIVKTFEDYETGQVVHGELLEAKDRARAKKAGTTGFAKGKRYDPRVVHFYAREFEFEPAAKVRR